MGGDVKVGVTVVMRWGGEEGEGDPWTRGVVGEVVGGVVGEPKTGGVVGGAVGDATGAVVGGSRGEVGIGKKV